MKTMSVLIAALAAFVACVALPAAAGAQCRLCDTPNAAATTALPSDSPIALEIAASLDFDQIIVLGYGSGSAVLGADGSRQTEGAVTALSPRAMVGDVLVRGEADRAVDVSLPTRIELFGADGSRIVLDAIEADLPGAPRLDEKGELRFRFGGRLGVDGGLEGEFRGDLTISVEYL